MTYVTTTYLLAGLVCWLTLGLGGCYYFARKNAQQQRDHEAMVAIVNERLEEGRY